MAAPYAPASATADTYDFSLQLDYKPGPNYPVVAAGYFTTCVIRGGGSVVCFGLNGSGQAGVNSTAT